MTHHFLSTLMSALLALHAVLGCCWHHAHACERECGEPCSVASPDAHADRAADGCGETDSANCGQHGRLDCQGNSCVFLNLANRSPQGSTLGCDLPAVACPSCGEIPAHVAAAEPFFPIDALVPPLRLHLAHRVLLL